MHLRLFLSMKSIHYAPEEVQNQNMKLLGGLSQNY